MTIELGESACFQSRGKKNCQRFCKKTAFSQNFMQNFFEHKKIRVNQAIPKKVEKF